MTGQEAPGRGGGPLVEVRGLRVDYGLGPDAVHAVIPIDFSKHYVNFLDPLKGVRRVTVRKFEQARQLIGGWTVVW